MRGGKIRILSSLKFYMGIEANDLASCPSNGGEKRSFTATATVKASDWGRSQLKRASLKRRIKWAWWKVQQMRQELSPAGLILWKRSGCDDHPWLFSAVNIEPSSSRRVCVPSNPSCRLFSSSLHHASPPLSASCPIVSVAFLFFFFLFSSASCSLSNRLLGATIGPPSPPLSSVPPLHFNAICPSLTFQPPTPSTPLLCQISV